MTQLGFSEWLFAGQAGELFSADERPCEVH